MAEVWLAQSTVDSPKPLIAVVKVIRPHLADNPDFVELFCAEAELGGRLEHPNIARFIEYGVVDGVHFMTFEFVFGKTLRQIQKASRSKRRALPPWFVLKVGVDVCRALHYAHEQRDERGVPLGIVHRDVTPDNIMVSFSGVTKVVDFGVAKTETTATAGATDATGKLAYLAPEQVLDPTNEGIDRRVDIYSLGVVLYELLTGVQPIRARNDMALLLKIPRYRPAPPSELARWIPSSLNTTIMTAMAKDPRDRFETAEQLAEALTGCLIRFDVDPTDASVSKLMTELFPDETRKAPPASGSTAPPPVTPPPPPHLG